jgi:uncharacterized protein YbaR (Trm112 family)
MITFTSLKHALNFIIHCPVCNERLFLDSKNQHEDISRIKFPLSNKTNDAYVVHIDTGNVLLIKEDNQKTQKKFLNFNGIFWSTLLVDCQECSKFSTVYSVQFDTTKPEITRVDLNFMSVTFEENNLISEVRTYYELEETWFITYDSAGKTRTTKFPMIDINLNNPDETLARIRKLVIFS